MPSPDVAWRPLADADLPDLVALMRRVLAEDGGLPLAGDESFLRRRFLGGESHAAISGATSDAALVAACGIRSTAPGQASAMGQASVTGVVDPDWRGLGLGARLLDWADDAAGDAQLRVETESLTPTADALFTSRGLRQIFAEDVMRVDLTAPPTRVPMPAGISLSTWTPQLAERFFGVYDAAFRDRPGFPGWSARQWIDWISDDEEFAPQWSLLATRKGADETDGGEDVGFVAAGKGWITQVGVVAQARGSGLGAALTIEALTRMHRDGEGEALLDVNVDNPTAARLYERLGFVRIGRRARYERA